MAKNQLLLIERDGSRPPAGVRRSRSSHLDEQTRELGRQGVAAAREALRSARAFRPDAHDEAPTRAA